MTNSIVLLMAAGASSRWAGYLHNYPRHSPPLRNEPARADHKLLEMIQIGSQRAPVVVHTLRALMALNRPVIVVMGDSPYGSDIERLLTQDLDWPHNSIPSTVLMHRVAAAQTLGDSMASGMAAISKLYPTSRVLVALADMPWIKTDTLQLVVSTLDQHDNCNVLVRPAWQGQVGHPVGFGAAWLQKRDELRGQAGARDWFKQADAQTVIVPTQDPGVILDIDTPEDLHPHLLSNTQGQ